MALLGREATISVSTDGNSWTEVGGINTIDIDEGYNTADISEMLHVGVGWPRKVTQPNTRAKTQAHRVQIG